MAEAEKFWIEWSLCGMVPRGLSKTWARQIFIRNILGRVASTLMIS